MARKSDILWRVTLKFPEIKLSLKRTSHIIWLRKTETKRISAYTWQYISCRKKNWLIKSSGSQFFMYSVESNSIFTELTKCASDRRDATLRIHRQDSVLGRRHVQSGRDRHTAEGRPLRRWWSGTVQCDLDDDDDIVTNTKVRKKGILLCVRYPQMFATSLHIYVVVCFIDSPTDIWNRQFNTGSEHCRDRLRRDRLRRWETKPTRSMW